MKILIVSESVPFPAYNGRELPLDGIFSALSATNDIHLLVLGKENKKDQSKKIPSNITFKGFLQARRWSNKKRFLQTIKTLRYPISPFTYNAAEIQQLIGDARYDYVWISPVAYYGFADFCKKNNLSFFKKVALGLNDTKTYLYRDQVQEITKTGIFHKDYFMHWLQSFLIKREERSYLSNADLIHVQTENEQSKVEKIIGANNKTVVAPNGVKQELFSCNYNGTDSNDILFMTHLDGGRAPQSKWFIEKIWNKVHAALPNARLLIVGKPPSQKLPWINEQKNIVVHGYAEDLTQLFNSVRLVVVPTFHSTGLINRIADAMAAGLPVISTSQAISTFSNIKIGTEIIAAEKANDFANTVINLFQNKEQRQQIAAAARAYAKAFPSWQQTAVAVETALKNSL